MSSTTATNSTTLVTPSGNIGLLAGVITFVLVSMVFGIGACIAMCRLRIKTLQQQKCENRRARSLATSQGVVLHLLTPFGNENLSTAADQLTQSSPRDNIKKSIAIKHYMKNGFHLQVDDEDDAESPATKRPLTKVKSTPPKLEKEADEGSIASVITDSNSKDYNKVIFLDVKSLKRTASLKVRKTSAPPRHELLEEQK